MTKSTQPVVAILMGSRSDLDIMRPASEVLGELGVPHVMRVLSAHRTPERTAEFARSGRERGLRVFICAAGGAAHLAGAVAAQTTLPVIGVPLARTPLGGADALYATVQMPSGIPVATVAIDGAANAALLAAQILAVSDEELDSKLRARRDATAAKVAADDDALAGERDG
ncbi:MAG TPA: 5-(carboxyamino)imidazole ribonucleotide mutase [Kofleriaceae bacterium]|nr:5-(carboxyamino)imidazole ribonucleotide mutase [Kofleriaceae bacterium]